MRELTPEEIVKELDNYIIGQDKAKRAVAIALRNRWRRQQIDEPGLKEEIFPNNIILIGPTGVGKTEISRRLANLARAPFIKVEASKFTEVGYVGRDVESIIRDLANIGVSMVKEEMEAQVREQAEKAANEKILDILFPVREKPSLEEERERFERTRQKLRDMLNAGDFEYREVEIQVRDYSNPMLQIFTPAGMEEMGLNFQEIIGGALPKRRKTRKLPVKEAREILIEEEAEKLIDMEKVKEMAIQRVEEAGIVFLDEIDKIASRDSTHGPDVSREGVQRDILPIVEGSRVNTKYGPVRTDHVLFIAAGAFHMSKPSDLIPELQGRFPIRVELNSLSVEDFRKILTNPKNALLKQYKALLKTEGIELEFTEDAIEEIAKIAAEVNEKTENIGARRLHTVMSTLLDDLLFNAPTMSEKKVSINADFVRKQLSEIVKDRDLSRYIL